MKDFYIPKVIEKLINGKEFLIDDIGKSDSCVLIFDDMVLKIRPENDYCKNEHAMMNWLKNKVPAPEYLFDYNENGKNYFLMTKVPGKMSCDDEFMKSPEHLITVLAEALKILWDTDISNCPVKNDLSTVLCEAEQRVEHGLVDVDDAEPETFGEGGFKSPEELLRWLYDNKPDEDFVLSHGDFCLPNIFIENGSLSGFVDIGRMGVADRYQDIALCLRSLRHNFEGLYNGISYGGFDEKLFFDALGIEPDFDKIRYYILLDELF